MIYLDISEDMHGSLTNSQHQSSMNSNKPGLSSPSEYIYPDTQHNKKSVND